MPPEFQTQSPATNFGKPPIFITILIVIAGLLGAFQIYQATRKTPEPEPENLSVSQPDKFTDWKTYRNEEYGFEFRYPNGWVLEADRGGISLNSPENEKAIRDGCLEGCPLDIIIAFDENNDALNASEYYDGNPGITAFDNPDRDRELIISGKPSYRLYPITGMFPGGIFVVIPLDKIFIRFDASLYDTSVPDQILSTFKFISTSTPAIDTSDWKTYTNTKYKFEIKYPASWEAIDSSGLLNLEKRFLPAKNTNPAVTDGFCKLGFYAFDDKLKNETIKDWLYRIIAKGDNPAPTNLTTATFGSTTGLREIGGEVGIVNSVYLPLSDISVLSTSLLCGDDVLKSGVSELDQILSTLKFTP